MLIDIFMRLFLLLFFLITPANCYAATITRVIDGDTIVVDGSIRVRLYGIDCPERGQPGEIWATECTASLVLERQVSIEAQYQDRFGRTVAIVLLENGLTVQEALLLRGAAWVAPRYCKLPQCSEWKLLEETARLSGVGIWAEPHPIPPWTWRKQTK